MEYNQDQARLAEANQLMANIGKRMLTEHYKNVLQNHYRWLGWTPLHEEMWRRFDRCCHEGRRLETKSFPLKFKPGKVKENLVVRSPKLSDEAARKIASMYDLEPATPTRVDDA